MLIFGIIRTVKEIVAISLSESSALDHAESVWLFGSLAHNMNPSDVDILLVYDPTDDTSAVKALCFREIMENRTLTVLGLQSDVILLTKDEEEQVLFARDANAIRIWSS